MIRSRFDGGFDDDDESQESEEHEPTGDPIAPCPFCETECTTDDVAGDGDETIWFFVMCPGCGATGPPMESSFEAIQEWSERSEMDEDLPSF